jgi:hypothetical protein
MEEGQEVQITFLGGGRIKVVVDMERLDYQALLYSSCNVGWLTFSGIYSSKK